MSTTTEPSIGADVDAWALLNVGCWFVAFAAVAVRCFRRVGERE